jgi:ABC-type glutathione transport system ATPase component
VTRPLLEVQISVDYPGRPGTLENVAVQIAEGEILGLAGESGAGKSTIALAILGLLPMRGGRARGQILFSGGDLLSRKEKELRRIRGREISLVLQSPMSALNPALRLDTQFREAWRAHSSLPWRKARPEIVDLLRQMGLPAEGEFLSRYPAQMSVGQAQRAVIAMAAMHRPRLILADEPTSALDPASRSEIIELFRRQRRDHGTAILYISHDLESMYELCDRVCVLRKGGKVESASNTPSELSAAAEAISSASWPLPESASRVMD